MKTEKNNIRKLVKPLMSFHERSCTSPVFCKTIAKESESSVREKIVDENRRIGYQLKTVMRHPKENFEKFKVSDFALENLTAAGVSLTSHSVKHSSLETVSNIQSQINN